MRINTMTYQPIFAGALHGTMAIHIEFGERIDTTVQDLLGKLKAVFIDQNSSVPVVNICWKETESTTDFEMATLVNVLKDKGIIIVVTTDGSLYPSWYRLADHIIAVVNNEPWLEFDAHSIIYSPKDDDALIEPSIGQNNIVKNAVGFIAIGSRSKRDMLMFLKNARFGWRVLSRKEKITTIDIGDL